MIDKCKWSNTALDLLGCKRRPVYIDRMDMIREKIPIQNSHEYISRDELRDILYSTEGIDKNNVHIERGDSEYSLVDVDHFDKFLEYDRTDKNKYTKKFDCNSFSTILIGRITEWDSTLAAGEIFGHTPIGPHAFNVIITTDHEVEYLESQTDKRFKPNKNWMPWFAKF